MKLAAIVIMLAVMLPISACAAEAVVGSARVIDGDTIEINDQRIRLWGIDAPKLAQRCTEGGASYPCGFDASRALDKYIGRSNVVCVRRDTDRYSRTVGVCMVGGVDLSQWMVQQGQAIAFRKYSQDYVADEDRTRAAKLGIWAGEFQVPSDFRHRVRPRPPRQGHRTCTCPADLDRAGHRCGRRSVHARSGAVKRVCVRP